MNFHRIPGESLDALLVRFDMLRARAQHEAVWDQAWGFGLDAP